MQSSAKTIAAACAFSVALTLGACSNNEVANNNRPVSTNTARVENANVARTAEKHDYTTPDGIITAKTKLALMADKNVSAFDVDVDTAQSVVTLSGKVETQTAKDAADRVAKSIDGVKSVNNVLQIVPDSAEDVVSDSDANIKKAVSQLLDESPGIKDLDLSGEVNAGVVTLKGSLTRYGDLLTAAEAVRKIKGVKQVVTTAVKVETATASAPAMPVRK